uniref:Uncharacterized protein n=1 Tax=Lactuca sativa TaxID=4236 RepID=A0A9R1WSY9_LACSA|nr:hypothetical protein LSAT_V11C100033500 [Lactuca sativa]
MHRYADPDQPKSILHDMMQYLIVALKERGWIMVLVSAVMQHLGMDYPPFPKAGPSIPPPSQPQNAGHDGAGTSGIHLGDTDVDNEDTEDEEAEYKNSDE